MRDDNNDEQFHGIALHFTIKNNGTSTFLNQMLYRTDTGSRFLNASDVSDDRKVDLVVVSHHRHYTRVFFAHITQHLPDN